MEFATKLMRHYPPHVRHVATFEFLISKGSVATCLR